MIYTFVKEIDSQKLLQEIVLSGLDAPERIDTAFNNVYIIYENELSIEDASLLSTIVENHIKVTSAENLKLYLENHVFPFKEKLIQTFAAENITMGITQLNKTGPVLGMFCKQYNVNSDGLPFSLKETFDTGSLYESLKVIQHLRNNPLEYDGLGPFVTDQRLLELKNKIETFLGVPNSI